MADYYGINDAILLLCEWGGGDIKCKRDLLIAFNLSFQSSF